MIPMHRMMLTVCSVVLLLMTLPLFAGAAPVVRVGYEQNHPMAGTADNGKAQGIMIDIVEEIARQEGWTLHYAPCIWSKCLEDLENAKIDLLVGIAYTPERAQKFSTIITPSYQMGLLYSRPDKELRAKRST